MPMHSSIAALLELHDVNRQRQVLISERKTREARIAKAAEGLRVAREAREAAEGAVGSNDALIRQYTADIQRCDATVEKLREQQMSARTNKEYLACINGIENAKSEKKLREESLTQLGAQVAVMQGKVDEAKAKEAAAQAALDQVQSEVQDQSEAETSEAELDRIYNEHKAKVDPKLLEVYERLITARHPMPLMKVNGRTRATPMGNVISTQHLEMLRLGQLVTDQTSNAILYVDED